MMQKWNSALYVYREFINWLTDQGLVVTGIWRSDVKTCQCSNCLWSWHHEATLVQNDKLRQSKLLKFCWKWHFWFASYKSMDDFKLLFVCFISVPSSCLWKLGTIARCPTKSFWAISALWSYYQSCDCFIFIVFKTNV